MRFAKLSTKQRHVLHTVQCSGVSVSQEDIRSSLTALARVCVKLGDHSAATVVHCIIRLTMITLSLPLCVEPSLGCEVKSSQFSKRKITDTQILL